MKKFFLPILFMCPVVAMGQSMVTTTYIPVEVPHHSFNPTPSPTPPSYVPQSSTPPRTQLVKAVYKYGSEWKQATIRLADDGRGLYIYSMNAGGLWQQCDKSYVREISQYDKMSKFYNYYVRGSVFTFYF